MTYTYKTHGTCATKIILELEENIIKKVQFVHGCHGNSQGIAKLVEGMAVEVVKEKLKGIRCEGKPTSCPDQLVKAIQEAYQKQNNSVQDA